MLLGLVSWVLVRLWPVGKEAVVWWSVAKMWKAIAVLLLFFLSGYTTMFLTFGGKPSATDKCLALGTDAGPLVNTFNSYFGRFADRMRLVSEDVQAVTNTHMTGLFNDFDEFLVENASGKKFSIARDCAKILVACDSNKEVDSNQCAVCQGEKLTPAAAVGPLLGKLAVLSVFWKIQSDNLGLIPAFLAYAILLTVQCKCLQNTYLIYVAIVVYAVKVLLEVPSNGLLWPVKAPVYQVLPSLFFVSALMHSNIQGDVANLFTYVIYNTPSLANLKPDADALHAWASVTLCEQMATPVLKSLLFKLLLSFQPALFYGLIPLRVTTIFSGIAPGITKGIAAQMPSLGNPSELLKMLARNEAAAGGAAAGKAAGGAAAGGAAGGGAAAAGGAAAGAGKAAGGAAAGGAAAGGAAAGKAAGGAAAGGAAAGGAAAGGAAAGAGKAAGGAGAAAGGAAAGAGKATGGAAAGGAQP